MAESRENDMEANRAARDAVAADGDTRREIRDIVTRTVADGNRPRINCAISSRDSGQRGAANVVSPTLTSMVSPFIE